MAVSKRIQVLLKPHLTAAVEELAEQQGETLSRMTALLVQEALTARGISPSFQRQTGDDPERIASLLPNRLPSDVEESTRHEEAPEPQEVLTWTQRQHQRVAEAKLMSENLPEGTTVEKVSTNSNTGDQVQLQKLKLMQELMDQLKSM